MKALVRVKNFRLNIIQRFLGNWRTSIAGIFTICHIDVRQVNRELTALQTTFYKHDPTMGKGVIFTGSVSTRLSYSYSYSYLLRDFDVEVDEAFLELVLVEAGVVLLVEAPVVAPQARPHLDAALPDLSLHDVCRKDHSNGKLTQQSNTLYGNMW